MSDGIVISIGGKKVAMSSKIGEGGFATVFKAKDKKDKPLVIKKMTVRDPRLRTIVENEFKVIRAINGHPFICHFEALEVKKEGDGFEAWALMEALDKSLMDLLIQIKKDKLKMDEEAIWDVAMALCKAISYMHEQDPPITHRDVKPENLLMDSKGLWKLIDFGSCWFGTQKLETKEDTDEAERIIESTSTPLYRAPEMTDFFGVDELTEKVDEWAIGCILYTCCFLTNPFQKSGKLGVINAKYTVPKDNTYSRDLLKLIKDFLTADPEDRMSAADAISVIEEHCSSKYKKDYKIKEDGEELGGEFPAGKSKKGIKGADEKKEKKHHHKSKDKKKKKESSEEDNSGSDEASAPPPPPAPAAPAPPAPAPMDDLFSISSAPAPQPMQQQQMNPFGMQQQQPQQMNPFGMPQQQQQMNPFGAPQQQQQMNPFGAPPQQQNNNPFGF